MIKYINTNRPKNVRKDKQREYAMKQHIGWQKIKRDILKKRIEEAKDVGYNAVAKKLIEEMKKI